MPWLIPVIAGTAGYFGGVLGPRLFQKDGTGVVTVDTKGKDLTVNPVMLGALALGAYFLFKNK
jgi:hypothetical protein